MSPSSETGRKRVRFQLVAEPGSEVFVAGTFNGWNPNKNRLKYRGNVYSTTLLLPGGTYEYKFVVNGDWCVDPECRDWVPNDLGSLNSVVTVG